MSTTTLHYHYTSHISHRHENTTSLFNTPFNISHEYFFSVLSPPLYTVFSCLLCACKRINTESNKDSIMSEYHTTRFAKNSDFFWFCQMLAILSTFSPIVSLCYIKYLVGEVICLLSMMNDVSLMFLMLFIIIPTTKICVKLIDWWD